MSSTKSKLFNNLHSSGRMDTGTAMDDTQRRNRRRRRRHAGPGEAGVRLRFI